MTAFRCAVVLLAGVLITACGVRSDPSPRTLSAGEVPYGLLEQAPSTTTSATTPAVPKAMVLVYYVVGDRVHPVAREVTQPVTVAKAITVLLAGPQEDEAVTGIRSAINPAAGILPRRIDPATFVVDVSADFVQGSTSEQVLGLAQIVFTATEIAGVTGVRFTLEGAPIEVPTPSGALTAEPVGRDAFATLAPVSVPPDLNPPS